MTILTAKRKLSDPKVASSALKSKKQRSLTEFFSVSKTNATPSSNVEEQKVEKRVQSKVERNCSVANVQLNEDKPVESFRAGLTPEQLQLLSLEMNTIDATWFRKLRPEFTKHYFLQLKRFVIGEQNQHTVFPPPKDVYSWTRLTPFDKVRVVVIGQDPYHNHNQAHGLAFSVKPPTPAPPSLKNIYKELQTNYPDFVVDLSVGDLSHWSEQGVLLLNTSLTVRAHSANSHSKKGWEPFTNRVVQLLVDDRKQSGAPLVFLLWGSNAAKLVEGVLGNRKQENFLVLKSVHPSPLSASRGFFGNYHFKKINDWLYARKHPMIDWSVSPSTQLKEVMEANENL
ncbi:uracil-DNA glycosylase Ecym_4090 [Eremothecium cymbalariae DBVPG|uniref:Uracil-DNA glycosylase n=1 Tax=Eremothecium cymbalariae (strain CBS 270.75 / DBVPG 7215 / KCTC 17166 / NRRL Y-17582) TaxID=931890 RepID=G8JT16_ERECY|nr:hypothetical protein Ecym_4090 [Eremothecium cymbalariae DBVPG\